MNTTLLSFARDRELDSAILTPGGTLELWMSVERVGLMFRASWYTRFRGREVGKTCTADGLADIYSWAVTVHTTIAMELGMTDTQALVRFAHAELGEGIKETARRLGHIHRPATKPVAAAAVQAGPTVLIINGEEHEVCETGPVPVAGRGLTEAYGPADTLPFGITVDQLLSVSHP